MKNKVLPEFQEYLRAKNLVKEKYILFFAHWARKFLSFSNNKNLTLELRVEEFLNYLRSQDNISDWQIKQADNAVQLYVNQFLERNESSSLSTQSEKTKNLSASSEIIEEMREALRIKHYAYRTELVYIDWTKEFYAYIKNVKKKDLQSSLDSADVRSFLSHLALKKRVAASTQNQALL